MAVSFSREPRSKLNGGFTSTPAAGNSESHLRRWVGCSNRGSGRGATGSQERTGTDVSLIDLRSIPITAPKTRRLWSRLATAGSKIRSRKSRPSPPSSAFPDLIDLERARTHWNNTIDAFLAPTDAYGNLTGPPTMLGESLNHYRMFHFPGGGVLPETSEVIPGCAWMGTAAVHIGRHRGRDARRPST